MYNCPLFWAATAQPIKSCFLPQRIHQFSPNFLPQIIIYERRSGVGEVWQVGAERRQTEKPIINISISLAGGVDRRFVGQNATEEFPKRHPAHVRRRGRHRPAGPQAQEPLAAAGAKACERLGGNNRLLRSAAHYCLNPTTLKTDVKIYQIINFIQALRG
jgi:hypothetical protein